MTTPGHLSVVDTNVPIVANRKSDMSLDCALACVRALHEIMVSGRIALDSGRIIIGQYMSHLLASGQPGVGDKFLKWVLTHQANPARCVSVPVTPKAGDPPSFEEFPNHPGLVGFDVADRIFVAVSAADPDRPPILQASDSKWWGWKNALEQCGVRVDFLCPEELAAKYREKMGTS